MQQGVIIKSLGPGGFGINSKRAIIRFVIQIDIMSSQKIAFIWMP